MTCAREYRLMDSLRDSDVPVPMVGLCQDETVNGRDFLCHGVR